MIGYYVHHHGRGHLARATSICARLRSPVTVLSPLAPSSPGTLEHGCADHVRLPRDDEATTWTDPTASGALHWAPLHDNGLRQRMCSIAEWVSTAKPDVMVVDVSVEVAMMVRLLGVPTVVMAMPGDRTDPAHGLVYRTAGHIIAAWPKAQYEPSWLRQHATKTTYVGGISRFDGRANAPGPGDGRMNVLILSGAGGSEFDLAGVTRCATAHPQFQWSTLGVPGGPWTDDPWQALCSADVVISAAGQSSIADVATAARPAVVIAAQRPFAEQRATAWALERGGLAVARHGRPPVDEWSALIDRAQARGTDGWQRWETRGAAARAAAVIERVARGHKPVGTS